MTKKVLLALIISAGCVFAANAQVTVSGGFAISNTGDVKVGGTSAGFDGGIGYGGNVYLDYMLPISIPMSLGFEIGYDTSKVGASGSMWTVGAIPLLLRAAYHFDLMAKLDLFVVGKIGYVIGDASDIPGETGTYGGIAFGFDAGIAYYFTGKFGVFAEAGFEKYTLKGKSGDVDVEFAFDRFATVGVSAKF